jgi:putative flippase GtrA
VKAENVAKAVAQGTLLDFVRARTGRPLRYVGAAAVNTAVGLALYPTLLWAFAPLRRYYLLALGISQLSCVLFAFGMYKLTVFRTRGNLVAEFARFSSFYLVNYAVNWIVLPLLVEVGHIKPAIAQVGFSLFVMIGSYFWHSRVTFRRQGKE